MIKPFAPLSALTLAAFLAVSPPAAAQSTISSSYGNLTVTIIGSGSVGTREGPNGFEARINDNLVVIGPTSITINGVTHPVTAEAQVTVDGTNGLVVTADGTPVGGMDPALATLMADAEAGIAGAQNNLGNRYFDGEGVPQDMARANELYLLAANQGLPEAQTNLAYSYYNGDGTEVDYDEAARLAGLAAAQNHPSGLRLTALLMYEGNGHPMDRAQAAQLWAQAANLGDDISAYNMGIVVRDGHGVLQDRELAILWFERALELGHPRAAERLEELRSGQ